MKRIKRVRPFFMNVLLGGIALCFFGAGATLVWVATLRMPDLGSFDTRKVSQSTKIYDRTGQILLYDVHSDIKRTVVPFEEISRHIKNATVAIEDAEFYQHRGIRPLSFMRAVLANLQTGSFGQGGSTITQQVVKNALLTVDKKVSRKIKEWILSVKLERALSKDAILSHYLNETPYGGNMYGVEQASKTFFNKKANEVTLAEAAYLAALPQAPSYYSPYGNNRGALEERKGLVLMKMLENGFINQEEYDQAMTEVVTFQLPGDYGIKAPHFVIFVKEYLEQRYGTDTVENGGLTVITTLDYNLQIKAEELAKKYALQNKTSFNAENVGIIAVDPKNGDILAMVGSRDYFDKEIDGNFNITLARRQPGSSFKPFVYATAFKKGYLPETVVFDAKTEFSTHCNPDGTPIVLGQEALCYMPENYDHTYRGPVSLRNALAQSINIPAIKALYLAGLQDSLETARDFGITSLGDINRYGLTLVLGGGEVSLLELTSAYGVFANNGTRNPYRTILSISDTNGAIIEQAHPSPRTVIDPVIAQRVSDVLSDNTARAPAFGERSHLYIPERDVAVKTGTTNDYRDAWIVGYSPNIAIGAWAGNNDNSPMEKKVAGFIIAPLWNEIMTYALTNLPSERFTKPPAIDIATTKPQLRGVWQGNTSYTIDTISGKLATEHTPKELQQELFVQDIHTILHWIDKKNPAGPPPTDPTNDPQYLLWEYAVQKWVNEHNLRVATSSIPTEYDNIHTPQNTPIPLVTGLQVNQMVANDARITIGVQTMGTYPLSQVDFFLNGRLIESKKSYPFSFVFTPKNIPGISTQNELLLILHDTVKNKKEVTIPFTTPL